MGKGVKRSNRSVPNSVVNRAYLGKTVFEVLSSINEQRLDFNGGAGAGRLHDIEDIHTRTHTHTYPHSFVPAIDDRVV